MCYEFKAKNQSTVLFDFNSTPQTNWNHFTRTVVKLTKTELLNINKINIKRLRGHDVESKEVDNFCLF